MPYSVNNPPDRIKGLPKHGQEIFIAAFNNAIKSKPGDEKYANRVAWGAVKTKYKQVGDKWVASDNKKENQAMPENLVEMMVSPVTISIVEENGEKAHIARFHVSRGDEVNGNKRIYPSSIWQTEAKKISEGKKVVLGQSGHPYGTPDLLEQFLFFRSANMEGPDFYADAKVIMTSKGRDFVEIAKSGIPLPVSTRGSGSTKTEERDGARVGIVQEDYDLQGIDVLVPGTQSFKDAAMVHFEALDSEQAQDEADAEQMMKDGEAMMKAGKEKGDDEMAKKGQAMMDKAKGMMHKEDVPAPIKPTPETSPPPEKNEAQVALESAQAELSTEKADHEITKAALGDMSKSYQDTSIKLKEAAKELTETTAQLTTISGERDNLSKELESTKTQAKSLQEELDKALNHLSAHAKLVELAQGNKFALPLITKLQTLPTAEEVEKAFAIEEAALMSQLGQQPPLGRAKPDNVLSEELGTAKSEEELEMERTRRLQARSGMFLS